MPSAPAPPTAARASAPPSTAEELRRTARLAGGRVLVVGGVRDAVAGLLLGASCAACGGPGTPLCRSCALGLRGPSRRTTPSPPLAGFPPTWTTATYAGVARAGLLAHKEEGRLALVRPLGEALAVSVAAALRTGAADPLDRAALGTGASDPLGRAALGTGVADPLGRAALGTGVADPLGRAALWTGGPASTAVALVPVPSSRSSTRTRGHDPLLRIARVAAARLRSQGCPASVAPVLRHRRRIADQAGLGAVQRRANLAGSLWLPPTLRPLLPGVGAGRVVLVDDVVTTGATLAEAARALAAAGIAPVCAATVAATVRRARSARR